jgi:iron complex outermembrane receptor protein
MNSRYKFSGKDSISLAVSRNIRLPSFTELYYSDSTTIGSAGLKEESSLNYQAGYDHRLEGGSCGTIFFLRKEENTIDWIENTSTPPKWQAENIPGADVAGVESYFKMDINPEMNLDSNYTYVNKQIDNRGYIYKYGQNYARHLANMLFNFKFPFADSFFGFTYKKKPGRDGWVIINTGASRQVNKNLKVYLKAENLFNSEYQEIEGIPQPGRWLELGMRAEW